MAACAHMRDVCERNELVVTTVFHLDLGVRDAPRSPMCDGSVTHVNLGGTPGEDDGGEGNDSGHRAPNLATPMPRNGSCSTKRHVTHPAVCRALGLCESRRAPRRFLRAWTGRSTLGDPRRGLVQRSTHRGRRGGSGEVALEDVVGVRTRGHRLLYGAAAMAGAAVASIGMLLAGVFALCPDDDDELGCEATIGISSVGSVVFSLHALVLLIRGERLRQSTLRELRGSDFSMRGWTLRF